MSTAEKIMQDSDVATKFTHTPTGMWPVMDACQGGCVRSSDAQAEIARLTRDNAAWQRNCRDTFEAMCAMRDAINEHVPMPSLESDLLQGPENSILCATVAEAVISRLTTLTTQLTEARAGEDELAEVVRNLVKKTPFTPTENGLMVHLNFDRIAEHKAALASHDKRKEGRS